MMGGPRWAGIHDLLDEYPPKTGILRISPRIGRGLAIAVLGDGDGVRPWRS